MHRECEVYENKLCSRDVCDYADCECSSLIDTILEHGYLVDYSAKWCGIGVSPNVEKCGWRVFTTDGEFKGLLSEDKAVMWYVREDTLRQVSTDAVSAIRELGVELVSESTLNTSEGVVSSTETLEVDERLKLNVKGILTSHYNINENNYEGDYTDEFLKHVGLLVSNPLFVNLLYAGCCDNLVVEFLVNNEHVKGAITFCGKIITMDYAMAYKLYFNVQAMPLKDTPFLVRDFSYECGNDLMVITSLVRLSSTGSSVLDLAVRNLRRFQKSIPIVLEAGYLFEGDYQFDDSASIVDKLAEHYSKYFKNYTDVFGYEDSRPMKLM